MEELQNTIGKRAFNNETFSPVMVFPLVVLERTYASNGDYITISANSIMIMDKDLDTSMYKSYEIVDQIDWLHSEEITTNIIGQLKDDFHIIYL